MDISANIARQIYESEVYSIAACGFRGVGLEELTEIVKIIRSNHHRIVSYKLDNLYKHHPDTIELDRNMRKRECEDFNDNCDCFLPDVEFSDCYCNRKRREKIETTDKRNFPEYEEWRLLVFSRDMFVCQECGQAGGELNAHHIKPYATHPSLRLNVKNGKTLCVECHRKEHSKRE